MDIFSFISLAGGLALFLYGMNLMSRGLERAAGGKLEGILTKMTSGIFRSLFLGIGITAVIQSSSAVTVMLVGLVNSQILPLSRTVGVIMGSNIGTTVTAWILSLVGIKSDNIFVNLLRPEAFSPVLALIGVILFMYAKNAKKKNMGSVLIGFAILMYGMGFMSDAVSPLADMPGFASMLTAFTNPLLGILTGFFLTAVIQSSSASVGILQALSLTGSITYRMSVPIIMGQNIGTCITALIASIGVSRNARRVSVIHVFFNIIGTAVFLLLYYLLHLFLDLGYADSAAGPVGIAAAHSIFNIVTTAILLPFSKHLVKMAEGAVRTEPGKEIAYLDERLFSMPSVAVRECGNITGEMAEASKKAVKKAMEMLFDYSEKKAEEVNSLEEDTDVYEDKLSSYLVKLSGFKLSEADSIQVSRMLHLIGDFERIGDHAVNLVETAEEIRDKKIRLSSEGIRELKTSAGAIREIVDITMEAFDKNDPALARRVEPLEQVIDDLIERIKLNHINRLQTGECTIQRGFVLSDILTNFERVSDHCSNIALAIIEMPDGDFGPHEYIGRLKNNDDAVFREMYGEYKKKYTV